MLKVCLAVTLLFLCTACANQLGAAKNALEGALPDKDEFEYESLKSYPGTVVCGRYRAFGRWDSGGYSDSKPFIFRHGEADLRPNSHDLSIFCSDDAANSLYALFGISLTATSLDLIEKIRLHYEQIFDALELYQTKNARYPTTAQNLDALALVVPTDPWGRAYVYIGQGLAGVQGEVELRTLGADGKVGGKDEDADITSWHFKYIDHVISL